MAEDRLRIWETLFQRALDLIDSVSEAGIVLQDWSFGGGTVLIAVIATASKDIDIFVPDPQYLGYLTPLNTRAEADGELHQQADSETLFSEGEIDFVASAPLTENPTVIETCSAGKFGETSTKIIAKKVWHRGEQLPRATFSIWQW